MKNNSTFKNMVIRKLERQGYRVHPIYNDNQRCPFDLVSVNPNGKMAGAKLKPHGHLTKPEKEELSFYDMPLYLASEKYYGGNSEIHAVKVEKIL